MITEAMAKSKSKSIYNCQNCGAQRAKWEGRCSDCGAWNSFVEETFQAPTVAPQKGWSVGKTSKGSPAQALSLDQSLAQAEFRRIDTGYEELNRVLGGGLVNGSFVLLGGSPGIGKSTLLMQMAGGLAKSQAHVLYISGEESVGQTAARAQRLGVRSSLVEVSSESNLSVILDLARKKQPQVLIVDSIQTIFLPDLDSAPGTVSQVRECAGHLMGLAKNENMTVILVGHVTKDGSLAGPKVLEHMVDCVLAFDGDQAQQFRLLRSLKNRFGATHELGVFRMNSEGMEQVSNPSELFLEERGPSLIGSAVFSSMEGSRPLLCEVQALTLASPMSNPRRTALGIDVGRLHMITAVLDRHLDIRLAHSDIFINVVGGLKLEEPSSDLAVAAAILSTELRKPLEAKAIFVGELGLTGEVRAVNFIEQRIKEADKLGFRHFIVPASNKKHVETMKFSKDKEIYFVKSIQDLAKFIGMR